MRILFCVLIVGFALPLTAADKVKTKVRQPLRQRSKQFSTSVKVPRHALIPRPFYRKGYVPRRRVVMVLLSPKDRPPIDHWKERCRVHAACVNVPFLQVTRWGILFEHDDEEEIAVFSIKSRWTLDEFASRSVVQQLSMAKADIRRFFRTKLPDTRRMFWVLADTCVRRAADGTWINQMMCCDMKDDVAFCSASVLDPELCATSREGQSAMFHDETLVYPPNYKGTRRYAALHFRRNRLVAKGVRTGVHELGHLFGLTHKDVDQKAGSYMGAARSFSTMHTVFTRDGPIIDHFSRANARKLRVKAQQRRGLR